MIKRQLLFALRRLGRHKLTTGIHLLGLSFGILSCLVIYLFVAFEFSYDKFHADAGRLYRMVLTTTNGDGIENSGVGMTMPLAADLRREATGFSAVTGLYTTDSRVKVAQPGKPDRVIPGIGEGERQHISFVDSDYLDIFHYQWLAGNAVNALQRPFSVVLTESEARQYFGQGQPTDWIGRSVVYFDSLTVSVTGIVKDWEQNSDFGFRDLISYSTLEHSFLQGNVNGWNLWQSNVNVLVKLSPGTTVEQVARQFPAFFNRHKQISDDEKGRLSLQALEDIHFNAAYRDPYGRRAHKPTLLALAGIALFILVIAAINFVNLSTAQSVLRAKEVGVRKVLGSSRFALGLHFLIETGVIVAAAMGLALLLAGPVISSLHGFIPEGVALRLGDAGTLVFIGGMMVVTCLLAGWYPARALSSFLPVVSLRGQGVGQLNSKSYLRKGLIVFQFTVSLFFIIGTMMVGRQIHYMLSTDLGFKKDAILTVDVPWDQPNSRKVVLAAEIRRLAGVQEVSLSSASAEAADHGGTYLEYKGRAVTKIDAGCDQVDQNYLPVYGLRLLAGRNFYAMDTARRVGGPYRAFILNETAARSLGFDQPADIVGKQVSSGFGGVVGPVVGVVKDFHWESLHQKIRPFFFTTQQQWGAIVSVKLGSAGMSAGQVKALMGQVEGVFRRVFPETGFQARFFDESLERLYRREQQTAQIMDIAMGVAIFISCIGLFGLAAFTANQRTREIGIRKVLGASIPQLVSLISVEFILLVGLSVVVASPIAGWAVHRWLEDFAYRVSMPWWIYVMAGVAAVGIALVTVSFQAIRAAGANPVRSLRSE